MDGYKTNALIWKIVNSTQSKMRMKKYDNK